MKPDPCSWRCWIQENTTVLLLFMLVIIMIGVTVAIMHENAVPDEYAKWAEGFTEGLVSTLALAMQLRRPASPTQTVEVSSTPQEQKVAVSSEPTDNGAPK